MGPGSQSQGQAGPRSFLLRAHQPCALAPELNGEGAASICPHLPQLPQARETGWWGSQGAWATLPPRIPNPQGWPHLPRGHLSLWVLPAQLTPRPHPQISTCLGAAVLGLVCPQGAGLGRGLVSQEVVSQELISLSGAGLSPRGWSVPPEAGPPSQGLVSEGPPLGDGFSRETAGVPR